MVSNSPKPKDEAGEFAVNFIVRAVVIMLVAVGAPSAAVLWLHDNHWIHHEKLMLVYAENWATGEYKECLSPNVNSEEPPLTCNASAKGKTFKVRFNADTYVKGKSETTVFHWTCRRYEGGDATIDCEFKSAD